MLKLSAAEPIPSSPRLKEKTVSPGAGVGVAAGVGVGFPDGVGVGVCVGVGVVGSAHFPFVQVRLESAQVVGAPVQE